MINILLINLLITMIYILKLIESYEYSSDGNLNVDTLSLFIITVKL